MLSLFVFPELFLKNLSFIELNAPGEKPAEYEYQHSIQYKYVKIIMDAYAINSSHTLYIILV